MSFYLSNSDVGPTGVEPAEFIDVPLIAESWLLGRPEVANAAAPSDTGSSATHTYIGDGITIHWDGGRCIHAEHCTSGAPAVFDRDARPWVDPDGERADEIAAVMDTCPSGALSYTRTDGAANGRRGRRPDEDPARSIAHDPELSFFPQDRTQLPVADIPVTISPQLNGPLSIDGTVELTHPDGSTELAGRLTLCRCGGSSSKPRCDGSHARIGFRGPGVPS